MLVDDDVVEECNLNRLVNGTIADARSVAPKVRVLGNAIVRAGLGTRVCGHRALTDSPEAVAALVDCDVLFGCVDTAFGRYHLECIASAISFPTSMSASVSKWMGTAGYKALMPCPTTCIHGAPVSCRGAYIPSSKYGPRTCAG